MAKSTITFNTINVRGDGNCFYHALCKYMELQGIIVNHKTLRHTICDFMKLKAGTIANNLKQIEFPMTEQEIIEIANLHRHNGVFTDNELLQRVAMKVLKIPIRVYFGSGSDCWNPAKKSIQESCNLLCRDNHFQLLVIDNSQRGKSAVLNK